MLGQSNKHAHRLMSNLQDSVFSYTIEQPKSKSNFEFLMQQQLEKINSVTKQYEKIAPAFKDALSLYDDNKPGLSIYFVFF